MKKVILIVVSLALLLMPIVACEPSSEPKPFPPPEGYSSWDEYYEEYYKEKPPITSPPPSQTMPPPPSSEPEPSEPLPEPAPEELDTTPPVISEVDISHITESSATIKWETDEVAICQIEYGEDNTWDKERDLGSTFKTSHNVRLAELETKTTYHFRIQALDESGNEALSKNYDFTTKTVEELLSAMLYPAMTIGSYVHQLGYNLTNGSSQTITVTKVEFSDKNGNIKHTVSESTIQGTSHKGQLLSGNTFNWSVSFQVPYSTEEIEGWQVKWYCLDANGQKFTVKGKCSS